MTRKLQLRKRLRIHVSLKLVLLLKLLCVQRILKLIPKNCMDGRKAIQRQSLVARQSRAILSCVVGTKIVSMSRGTQSRDVCTAKKAPTHIRRFPLPRTESFLSKIWKISANNYRAVRYSQLVCHILRIFRACSITSRLMDLTKRLCIIQCIWTKKVL